MTNPLHHVPLIPREHGAYGELVLPLATALAIAGTTRVSVLTTVATVAAFVSHEPLLVVLGRRGQRATREAGARALAWLAASGFVAVVAGGAAVSLAPAPTRWSFVLPLVPAAVFVLALAAAREKSAAGEIAVAMALSFVAIPICVTAGAGASTAFSVAATFACLFSTATLGVRVVVLKTRGGGDRRAMRDTRHVLMVLTAVAVAALAVAAGRGLLAWITLAAAAPGLLVAVAMAIRPPAATRLRMVGWTLASTSVAAALMLTAAFRYAG